MAGEKPRLRKREIIFALAMGGLAAGGIAIALEESDTDRGYDNRIANSDPVEIDYELGDFTGVSSAGPQDVFITYGEDFAVRADGPANVLDRMEAVVEDNRLLIRPKNLDFDDDWDGLNGSTFYITMPTLDHLDTRGQGDIYVDRIVSESFEGIVSGAGEMTIDDMTVENASFLITGAGGIEVAGTAVQAELSIRGAGEIDAEGLHSQTADISVSGLGDVGLTVADEADINVTGAGEVDIYGSAVCSVTETGFADVTCEGADADVEAG